MILILSAIAGIGGAWANSTGQLHDLYFRENPGPGIVRLGVGLAMAWIVFVLLFFADPSVTGIYVAFYLVMGYAVVKLFGQSGIAALGIRSRVDAGERRNTAAAIVIAAFTIATGMIFGGSLWGEADPTGDDEGGWWIPLTFFILGWGVLVLAFSLFQRREKGFVLRLKRERDIADARAGAAFLLAAGLALTDATAGDFWGWRHGLFSFGLLAVLLLVHEAFAAYTKVEEPSAESSEVDARRVVESLAYLGLAVVAWLASRSVDVLWGAG